MKAAAVLPSSSSARGTTTNNNNNNKNPQSLMTDKTTTTNTINTTTKTKTNKLLTPVIWCILITETGERFAFYGFRAILVLYFTNQLHYGEQEAIALFAYTTALAYFSPLVGALLADSTWGRYFTILVFGSIYVIGLILLTLAAMEVFNVSSSGELQQQSQQRFWTMVGLILVCIGTGGIKPCVSIFGADQVGGGGRRGGRTNTPQQQQDDDLECQGLLTTRGEESPDDKSATIRNNNNNVHQEQHEEQQQVRAFFAYFYFCINVGALSSIAIIPIIRGKYGFGMSFLIPTMFMIMAMCLFFSMRKSYVHHKPETSLATTFRLCWWLIHKYTWARLPPTLMQLLPSFFRPGPQPQQKQAVVPIHDHDSNDGSNRQDDDDDHHPHGSHGTTGAVVAAGSAAARLHHHLSKDQQLSDAKRALQVFPIMALLPIFWCLYDQQGSVWTLQATRMELNGLQPEQLNVINPLEIMAFIPLFDKFVYPWMTKHHFNIKPLRRVSYGMLLAAMAFFTSGILETTIEQQQQQQQSVDGNNHHHKVNVFWQLPQITLLSIAEILVSVTGLEFAYSTSPDRLKAFLMSIFLLTTTVGDLLSGVLYSTIFATMNRATIMHVCGVLMLCNLGVFVWVEKWWDQQQQQQQQQYQSQQKYPYSNSDGIELQDSQLVV